MLILGDLLVYCWDLTGAIPARYTGVVEQIPARGDQLRTREMLARFMLLYPLIAPTSCLCGSSVTGRQQGLL